MRSPDRSLPGLPDVANLGRVARDRTSADTNDCWPRPCSKPDHRTQTANCSEDRRPPTRTTPGDHGTRDARWTYGWERDLGEPSVRWLEPRPGVHRSYRGCQALDPLLSDR